MVVGPDVHVARRAGQHHALEHRDDGVIVRPAADQPVGLLDGGLEHVGRRVRALGLEVRVLVEALVVLPDERLVVGPLIAARVREVIVAVHAGDDAFRMVLAERVRRHAEGQRRRELRLLEHPVAQRLLVHRHVVAAPHGGDDEVGLGRDGLGDVRGEVGRAELGPALGDDLRLRHHLLHDDLDVIERVAAVGVVGMDVGDALGLRPRLHDGQRGRHAVRRLDVRRAEYIMRIGHRLVEQEVRAAVDEHRQDLELFGHRPQRGGVARRRDAAEEIDFLGQLQSSKLFHVGVGAGVLVRFQKLDLPLAQQAAGRVDLLGGELLPLEHRLAQHGRGAREERHVADLVGRVRDVALRGGLGMGDADGGEPRERCQ
ncbi:MAG TPA: hypothetical protein VN646_13055 [Candidatus Acidoferrum sp.]|nr:hypothetical protein [Candidatus Acidoferrum sp.]